MSQPSTNPARPSQVTAAAWMIIVGSVFVVLLVWDRIAGLHSLESRQALQSSLRTPGLEGSGLDVSDLMLVVQVVSMVAAACATAMAILGYQTLQRSRGARLALSVLAGPLFLTGMVAGRFVSFAVAAAVVTLWLGPARAWFDGLDPARARRPSLPPLPDRPVLPPTSPPPSASDPEGWSAPPTSVYDARPAAGVGRPPASQPPSQPAAPSGPGRFASPVAGLDYGRPPGRAAVGSAERPSTVLWACVLTWIFSGLTALLVVASMAYLSANSSEVLRRMHDQNPALAQQGVSDHLILVICYVFCGFCVVWCAAAAICAVLLARRVPWAWYALIVSTSAVGALCLLGVIGSAVTLVPLAAATATVALLVRSETRRWFGR